MGYSFDVVNQPDDVIALHDAAARAYEAGDDERHQQLIGEWWQRQDQHGTHLSRGYGEFIPYLDAMRRLGMVVEIGNRPEWPRQVDFPDDQSYEAECERILTYDTGRVGIPVWKFETSDGWLVSVDEITGALEKVRPVHDLPYIPNPQRWDEWLAFLRAAQERGGFRVN